MGVIMQSFYWGCPDAEGQDGAWWNFLSTQIPHLQQTGFTAMWLPPASKAAEAKSMGYDPYDYHDLGDFNQKGRAKTWFGNKTELIALISNAHTAGLQVYADLVINHNSGADATELNPIDQKTRWTKFTPASGLFPAPGSAFIPRATKATTTAPSATCPTSATAIPTSTPKSSKSPKCSSKRLALTASVSTSSKAMDPGWSKRSPNSAT